MVEVPQLTAGEVGFVIAASRMLPMPRWRYGHPAEPAVPGAAGWLQRGQADVFSGLYPIDTVQYEQLRDALAKLKLNDSSFSFEPETRLPWASDSAADFWDCCTWRSSRNGWSVSSGWS